MLAMVATGTGTPSHWLNNLESNTQATATEMGGPALRQYENRQRVFGDFLVDLTYAALEQARACGALRHRGQPLRLHLDRDEYGLRVRTPELRKEDNLQLAQSAKTIIDGFLQLHDRGLIGDADLLDLSYRFAGELVNVEQVLERSMRC